MIDHNEATIATSGAAYNADGTVATQSASPGTGQTYTYYDQGQLATNQAASPPSSVPETWSFNTSTGQLASTSLLGPLSYACPGSNCPQPDALHTIGPSTLTYNASGDMVSGAGHWGRDHQLRTAWASRPRSRTHRGRPKRSTTVPALALQQYDAKGVGPGGTATTLRYFGDGASRANTLTIQDIYFGGDLVAQRDGQALTYLHTDQAGSPTLALSMDGLLQGHVTYSAYGLSQGGESLPSGSPGFAGTRTLLGTPFVQMGARLYDPEIENFLQSFDLAEGREQWSAPGSQPLRLRLRRPGQFG